MTLTGDISKDYCVFNVISTQPFSTLEEEDFSVSFAQKPDENYALVGINRYQITCSVDEVTSIAFTPLSNNIFTDVDNNLSYALTLKFMAQGHNSLIFFDEPTTHVFNDVTRSSDTAFAIARFNTYVSPIDNVFDNLPNSFNNVFNISITIDTSK